MDEEDPESFLRFMADGQVVPADNLSDDQLKRALETIRIFNLNGSLRPIRQREVIGYHCIALEIAEYAEVCDGDEWQPFLQEHLDAIDGLPFETAIRHVLQFP